MCFVREEVREEGREDVVEVFVGDVTDTVIAGGGVVGDGFDAGLEHCCVLPEWVLAWISDGDLDKKIDAKRTYYVGELKSQRTS